MPLPDPSIVSAFELLRRKLIQTSLRNRMINYRPPSARTLVGLDIDEELTAEIWKSLVLDKKKFTFTGPPDPPRREKGSEDNPEGQTEVAPAYEPGEVNTTDLILHSHTPKTRRETRLLATYRAALEQYEERGVNTLFLALGMLKWSDSAQTEPHLAPLILVPVMLERTANGSFKLFYDEGEIGTNLSLQVKLEEFGIKLPEIPTELDSFSPTDYFAQTFTAIEKQVGWEVLENNVALNFFNFEKIALFLDLDLSKWHPDQSPALDHDIAAALGKGYAEGSSEISEDTNFDEIRAIETSFEIFQADSSQLLVIEEARRGTSMVVEGPPGTGKSQTITNLIAEMVARGKKVLFVSEKMAALDVVYRKLEEAGLDNAALNLHGHKANRRSFYAELKRTWSLKSRLADAAVTLERLDEVRKNLNLYVAELHQPLAPYGVSPRRLIGLACTLPKPDDADMESGYDGEPLKRKSWEEIRKLRPTIVNLQSKVKEIGIPSQHPYWGSSLAFFGPDERFEAEKALGEAVAQGDLLTEALSALSGLLKLSIPEQMQDIAVLHRSVETAIAAPPLDGIAVRLGTWRQHETKVREVIAALRTHHSTIREYEAEVQSTAWGQDWRSVHAAVIQNADSFFGRLFGDYKKSASLIRAVLKADRKLSPDEVKKFSSALNLVQNQRSVISESALAIQPLYGVQWQGHDSSPDTLESLLNWVLRLEEEVSSGRVPETLINLFEGRLDSEALKTASETLKLREAEFSSSLNRCITLLKSEFLKLPEKRLADIIAKLKDWRDNASRVSEITAWNQLISEADAKGLGAIVKLASIWPHAAVRLENHVLWQWSRTAIRSAFEERQSLRGFERTKHENLLLDFASLDEEFLKHNRARAAHSHLTGLPAAGQVGLTAELYRQCEMRRGHKSIRWAFERFEDVLLQIKPICMMSPLSVATFLPRKANLFDVVIFDEASQVRPEDALSAMARAGQTIVVGDTRQMPPTSFFDTLAQDDADGEELEFDASVGKMESILALCSAAVQNSHRRRDLRWHYRSLHESLIRPSNKLFYDGRLVIFPSPVYATLDAGSILGIRFHYDPTAAYDRGAAKKVNIKQAEAVAAAALDHIKLHPDQSLMVVAFSKDQQQAVLDCFEKICQTADLSEYNHHNPYERFTVKNLETVQGDERDVVMISVGYGRDISGHLTMNFGPLNREGGGRRLNVLITRARMRTEVFTSIRSADIVVDSGKESGVRDLKVFLEFAETGILEDKRPEAGEEDSEFEIEVRGALEKAGYAVDIQVGTAGFRIDLAIRHPKRPGLYVLGIECDGASYHSARSARDRDKLRQAVLESRGWTLHRIWSTDWWKDREDALKRCLTAIEKAIAASDEEEALAAKTKSDYIPPSNAPAAEPIAIWTNEQIQNPLVGQPYKRWDRPFQLEDSELHSLPTPVMAQCVFTVVAFEGPIHSDLLVKRLRESAGLARAGQRIKDAVLAGAAYAVRQGNIICEGDFYYLPGDGAIRARSRAELSSADSSVDYIAPEELDDAALSVIESATRANAVDITEGFRVIFGFSRTPSALPNALSLCLNRLQKSGKIIMEGADYKLT